jgi:hypothetical protein
MGATPSEMASPPPGRDDYRRSQRRRALIGWLGGFLLAAALVALVVLSSGSGPSKPRLHYEGPYGETMTSGDYEAIEDGEEEFVVLSHLGASGRPEKATKPYVLVLFPPASEDDTCTYWEFTNEPQVFARLCFEKSSGDLDSKLKHNVLHPPGGVGGRSTIV